MHVPLNDFDSLLAYRYFDVFQMFTRDPDRWARMRGKPCYSRKINTHRPKKVQHCLRNETETPKERQRSVLMYSTNNDGGVANLQRVGEGG